MFNIFLYTASNYLAGTMAVILNSTLLYLIRYHSNDAMGDFRYILTNTAMTDLLIGACWAPIQNVRVTHCGTSMVVILGFANQFLDPDLCALIMFLVCVPLLIYSRLCFPIAFAFRYYSISSLSQQNWFTPRKLTFSLISIGIYAIFCGCLVSSKTPIYQDFELDHNSCTEMVQDRTDFGITIDEKTVMFPRLERPRLSESRSISHKVAKIMIALSSSLSLVGNFYFGFKSYKFLQLHSGSFSPDTRRKAKTTLKVIILQALLPPIVFVPTVVFAAFELNSLRLFALTLTPWIPAIAPLIPIYFFKSYNKAFLKLVQGLCERIVVF